MFVLLMLQDTPANCVQDKFLGLWNVSISQDLFKPQNDQVNCPKNFKSVKSVVFELMERGVALTTTGQTRSGTWSAVANQGFEVRLGEMVYFFFSDFEGNTSICNKASGWSHRYTLLNKDFRCATAALVAPKVSDIKPLMTGYDDPFGHNMWVGQTLPENFTWRNVGGKSYLPPVFDQLNCGSCFAVAATQSMMSRVMVKSKLADPLGQTKFLSVQHVVDCSMYSQGCDGGFGEEVAKFAEDFGILTSDEYSPYMNVTQKCSEQMNLHTKNHSSRYYFTAQRYVSGYFGADTNQESMKWELYRNGAFPVSILVDSQKDFRNGKRNSDSPDIKPTVPTFPELTAEQIQAGDGRRYYLKKSNHLVLLTGWGKDDQGEYWEIMNSWGDKWGPKQDGFTRIDAGKNAFNVESAPIIFYWAGHNVTQSSEQNVDGMVVTTGLFVSLIVMSAVFGLGVLVLGALLLFTRKDQYTKIGA